MNILLLAPEPFYQNRGTPIAVRLLAEELGRAGHRIDLLVFHEGEDVELPGVRLHRIPGLPLLNRIGPGFSIKKLCCDLLMLMQCILMMRHARYQEIHAVEEAAFIAWLLGRIWKIPYVYDMDSSMSLQLTDKYPLIRRIGGLLRWMEGGMMRSSAGIVAVCRSLEQLAREAAPKVPVVRLEDISLLERYPPKVEDIRAVYGIIGAIVLYVGNLEFYQGLDLLLESFALLPPARLAATRLVVIGGTPADIEHYRRTSRRLGIGEGVFFLGPRPLEQLGGYLAQADILVSPRIRGNNTPMKIYSYLDSGKPVLATRLPTHTQVLDDQLALLAPPNAGDFMQAMVRLLDDEALRTRLARAARERVRTHHSRQVFREKLNRFYGELSARFDGKTTGSRAVNQPR